MENKDVNTDYQRVVRLGDQKWQIVEITIKISFVCLFVCLFIWDLYPLFSYLFYLFIVVKDSIPYKNTIDLQLK